MGSQTPTNRRPNNEFWKLARNLRKTPNCTNRPLHSPQGLQHDPDEKADTFASHVEDAFQPHPEVHHEATVRTIHRQLQTILDQRPTVEPEPTTPREIESIIPKKASGADKVTAAMSPQKTPCIYGSDFQHPRHSCTLPKQVETCYYMHDT